jgi:hypothetical protein
VFVEELLSLLATKRASDIPNPFMQLAIEQASRSTRFLAFLYLLFNCNLLLTSSFFIDSEKLFSKVSDRILGTLTAKLIGDR